PRTEPTGDLALLGHAMSGFAWAAASDSALAGGFLPSSAFWISTWRTWLISLYRGTCGREIRFASSFFATGTICGAVETTCWSSYEAAQHGSELVAYLFCTSLLVRYVMYCQAACWFLLPDETHSAIDPLTPGAPAEPLGVGWTPTLPETFDFEASVAAAYAYVQLIMNAAEPSEN